MPEVYAAQLKAWLTLDDAPRVRGINHVDEFWLAEEQAPRKAAIANSGPSATCRRSSWTTPISPCRS